MPELATLLLFVTVGLLAAVLALLVARTASLRRELLDAQRQHAADQRTELAGNLMNLRTEIGTKLADQSVQSEQKLENIRGTMEQRIGALQKDNALQLERMQQTNAAQLDKMRQVVDEKLQDTLNKRISESFRNVQEQLLKVSEGLGDMQRLATDVGDLRNVMKNVKTKGILGEYQLGAIMEEILPREQYEENIATREGSTERVEFAVRLPGDGERPCYLPVDAKFPSMPYEELLAAREGGGPEAVLAAQKALMASIKQSAKTIHEKYVQPPNTTDFAIMFLPFEGLYAEVVNLGLVSELQQLYKVNIAGPTTMAALLNSMQMGFRTLAIQKRSAEVWTVLSAVKTEFANFEQVLESAQRRINQANSDLDKLIGTRTRAINRKLKDVASLSRSEESAELLDDEVGE
ncbi:MAG: DNA recombination protein RmuC [Clostridiales Family XIII bacterium]|jgi:DNA recombination protein RmuC|nr:DNA recombination protein RmuC [Clostridiales Family XIII bacterium]